MRPALQHGLAGRWPIALLLLVCALAYARTLGAYGMLMWDEAEYATLARSLARGDGYAIAGRPQALRPPLLPFAGAAGLWVAGAGDDRFVKVASLAFALLAIAVVYAAAARAYDRTTGLVAAALLATMPWFWTDTAHFLSEMPLLAFLSAALFAWSFALYRSPRWFYASWLCVGLALLSRYTALLFGPLALLLALAALATRDPAVRARLCSRDALLAPLLGAAVVAPWAVRQMLAFGDPLIGMRQAASQLQVYLPGVSMPWYDYLVGLPGMLSLPIGVLLLVGSARAVERRDRFALQCLIVVAFVLGWFSLYRYKEPRLISAMLPAAAVLAGVGMTRGLPGAAPPRPLTLALLVAAIAALNAVGTAHTFSRQVTLGYPPFVDAMRWMREHTPPTALLVGPNVAQMSWYADRPAVDFPDVEAELSALLARADWVVITNFERGQKPYAGGLASRVPPEAFQSGDAVLFRDRRFSTLVVRAERLR
ncbi:MAG: glycosyltransferase family 39 protein [Candidatus Binatia bacterium]